jgi:HNH endonuclease
MKGNDMAASTKPSVAEGWKRRKPVAEQTCAHCAYGLADPNGSVETVTCVNHVEAPGQLHPVEASGTCRNFRARRRTPLRLEPPDPPSDDVRYIALTQGKFALVDAADYKWLSRYKWFVSKGHGGKYYAMSHCGGRPQPIAMHRLIMKPPRGLVVDHIDGNGLNNRRCNLRVCTQAQNLRNRAGRIATSRFKGVSYDRRRHKWAACISQDSRTIHIGHFDDEIEAAFAYDLRAVALAGEFAYLNFPHIINATRQAACNKTRVVA